ncbi:hypothetical protein A2348_03725 [Candidatus Uhrbacteria bacterium RIFOXYB12_FULL_58_10]|uniref:Uncharacterized protein n=1 Tax=Candidatus Uhrbacteria bacterium RIFOXYB2_FULL_57_15 TaxID=1802422 RepID=A0A1F7W9C2_9BACT|nr:MAG: hypothetical protein A2348_03725 [Candidatus Uhrbacteria bacterium RIFOXYB12_FULL_58_10]OGL99411.1 MAG: hypothetical protein A2304_01295 [Candidatus Uhrbacteria bacterium RIFOXYB2_FULL_57_15]OGL99853.1 MAG: hypothetical protein A2501_05505 [Candidatus Uhrbacteria bacterium RIFOXYC12_FULL_57_11]
MIEKGPIFGAWNKKFVVAIHTEFYEHLASNVHLVEASKKDADFAWIAVDYDPTLKNKSRHLVVQRVIPSRFDLVLKAFMLTAEDVPPVQDFVSHLERLVARAIEQRRN